MYLFQEIEDASDVDCAGCDVACIARKGATAIMMDATTVDFVVGRLLLLLLLLLLRSCRAQVCAAGRRWRLKRLHDTRRLDMELSWASLRGSALS